MTCCDARSRLSALLDGALAEGEAAQVRRAANACRLCRAELEILAQNDRAVARALTAGAAAAPPPDYFEGLWGRVAARLDATAPEGESMRMTGSGDRSNGNSDDDKVPTTDVAGKPILNKDEISGLHDIKALATSTIDKSRQRRQTNPPVDAIDPGLMAQSPAALGNVVLPTPGKEVGARPAAAPASEVAGVSAAPGGGVVAPARSRASLFAVVALLVLAAGGGAYMLGRRGAAQPQMAQAPQAAQAGASPDPAARSQPVAEPMAVPVPVAPSAPAPEAQAPGAAAAGENGDDGQITIDDEGKASDAKGSQEGKGATKATEKAARGGGGRAEQSNKDADAKDVRLVASKGEEKKADAEAGDDKKGEAKPEAPKNEIDDLFGDKPAADKKVEEAKPALPEKLSQNDVKSGMGSVRARVQACYDKYKITGQVKLKVRIEPDGSVSKAEAVDDKFKGTETGACVGQAVSTAKFPAVSGPALTVTYPFLLQ